jgi:DNA-binding NarL/FixJ family response regulator
MQHSIHILAISTHEGIRATILRLIHNHSEPWQATGADSAAQAIALSRETDFDIVLLGNGLTETEEQQLAEYFKAKSPQAKLISHYGGGSGLLFGEIYEALDKG